MFCLWNVLILKYQFESLVLTGLTPEIPDELPEMRIACGVARVVILDFCAVVLSHSRVRRSCRVASGSLLSRGFGSSGGQAIPLSPLLRPSHPHLIVWVVCLERSVITSLHAPKRRLLQEPSTVVGQDLYESVIRLSFNPVCFSFSGSSQQGPRALTSAGSIGHPRLCPTEMMIMSVLIDSFYSALQ